MPSGTALSWKLRIFGARLRHLRHAIRTKGRRWLEYRVLYEVARQNPEKVLYIGVDHYTAWYPQLFSPGVMETIDIDPRKARYGAPTHYARSCDEIAAIWPAAYFDTVIMYGVYGWGLNSEKELLATLRGIRHALKDGGLLVFAFCQDVDQEKVRTRKTVFFEGFTQEPLAGHMERCFTDYLRLTFFGLRKQTATPLSVA